MKLEVYYDDKVTSNSYLDSFTNKAKNLYQQMTQKKEDKYITIDQLEKEIKLKSFEKSNGYGKKPIRVSLAHALTAGCILTPGTNFLIPYILYKYNDKTLFEIDRETITQTYQKLIKKEIK